MRNVFVIGISLFIVLIVVTGVVAYIYKDELSLIPNTQVRADGTIYFSARTNGPQYLTSLFALDVTNKKVRVLKDAPVGVAMNTEHLSADYNKTVYVETTRRVVEAETDSPLTLQIMSQITVLNAVTNTTQTITSSDSYKSVPRWSPQENRIAFAARPFADENEEDFSADTWRVMVTDLSGIETFVTNGFQPQWLPGGDRLLILKNDSLYVVDVATREAQRLSGLNVPTDFSHARMNLSPDGTRVALSDGDEGLVFLIHVDPSALSAKIERTLPLSAPGFWPVFSEDGTQLAIFAADTDVSDANPQFRISIVDLDTEEERIVYELDTFDPASVAITDWRG